MGSMPLTLTITRPDGLQHRSTHPVGDYERLLQTYDPFCRVSHHPHIGRPRPAGTVVQLIALWLRMEQRAKQEIP